MKKTILSTALLVLGVAFMACNFPIVKENWPMGGGPNGNFKVTTTGKVPLHWSVRNDKNIQWKLTLPEGGQSGIAVWEDKLFFTLNISKENLPLATLQSKLENFEQLYQTEMKRLEAAYLKDKKSKLSKYKVALENASKKWEDFLANHKKYQETKANIRVRMQKNLQQHTEPGKAFTTAKNNLEAYAHGLSPVLKGVFDSIAKTKKTLRTGQRDSAIELHCVDALNGKFLWKQRVAGTYAAEYNYGFSDATTPCPATDGNHVWAVNAAGGVACFTMDGTPVWSKTWEPTSGRPFNKQYNTIIYKDWLLNVAPPEKGDTQRNAAWNYLHALDKKTGETIWVTKEALTHYNAPTIGKTVAGKTAVMIGRGGPHGVPERPVGLSLISLEAADEGNEIWHWEPELENKISGWGALSTQLWDTAQVSWFYKDAHQMVSLKDEKQRPLHSLKTGKVFRFDQELKKYVLTDNTSLQGKYENQRHCNAMNGDYIYYMVRYQPFIARQNTRTGETVFVEVPTELDAHGNYVWQTPERNDALNSKGQRQSSDLRVQGGGFQKCFLGAPTQVNNHLFFTSAIGLVYVLDIAKENFDGNSLVAVNDLGVKGETWTVNSMTYANGKIFHRTLKELICVGVE